MPVVRFEVRLREAFAGGAPFGAAGPYERIDGRLHLAVDPLHPANAGIVDLDRASRDAQGLVRFTADLSVLQPVDAAAANRSLLADVVNRGGRTFVSYNMAPRDNAAIHPGDGFLMRRGWTIAAVGWQWDVVPGGGLLGLDAPLALDGGQPLVGWICVTHQLNAPATDVLLSDRGHRPHEAADVQQPDARMFVRDYPDAPRSEIPRERWRFARVQDGHLVADATRVAPDGGFEPGRFYDIVYRTRTSPVVGAGLLAFRDVATFLRDADADDNPARGRLRHAFAFGSSQSGRFLRTLIHGGFNVDEAGHTAYDGFHVHIAGGRMGEFNDRFGQPSLTSPYGRGYLPPFGYRATTDPVTGRVLPGVLTGAEAAGGAPKIIATNSATEYWRGDAAMLHVDPAGDRDLPEPAETRAYFLAGTQHGGATLPMTDTSPLEPGARGAYRFNTTDYRPLLRAALVNLERWVREGIEPPPSALPRVADGTAVLRAGVVEAFRRLPEAIAPARPVAERLASLPRLDLGPEGDRGAPLLPPAIGRPYPSLVSAVDDDGNEVAGLRLPDVTVPLATLMGWNPRHPQTGGAGQIMPLTGATIPFAVTAAARRTAGDPRPAVEERYRDREDYLSRVRLAAERLAADRYLLAEDIVVVVEQAAARWDMIVATALAGAPPRA